MHYTAVTEHALQVASKLLILKQHCFVRNKQVTWNDQTVFQVGFSEDAAVIAQDEEQSVLWLDSFTQLLPVQLCNHV